MTPHRIQCPDCRGENFNCDTCGGSGVIEIAEEKYPFTLRDRVITAFVITSVIGAAAAFCYQLYKLFQLF